MFVYKEWTVILVACFAHKNPLSLGETQGISSPDKKRTGHFKVSPPAPAWEVCLPIFSKQTIEGRGDRFQKLLRSTDKTS